MAILSFNHGNLYSNFSLLPSSPFQVGVPTSITITLFNSGPDNRQAIIHLWWVGPTINSTPGPMLDLVGTDRLVAPYGSAYPISFGVPAGGSGHITVAWSPSAADFPKATLGASVPGFLFAQAEIKGVDPYGPPADTSALNCWSPAYELCAQHNISIAT